MNVKEFLQDYEVSCYVKRIYRRPDEDFIGFGPNARHYEITLYYEDRHYRLHYSQGCAHTADPTLEDVLECLVMDSAYIDRASSFEEWADEFGYDTDSRKAEKIYKACKDQYENLQYLFGEAFEDFLNIEEE